jgi:hypothetical protein
MNIISVFAGRKKNMEILCKYLSKALEMKIIDEVHLWNYSRNMDDDAYLRSIANLKRTSSTNSGTYFLIYPIVQNNSFQLQIKAPNDIHVQLKHNNTEYEIVLGGWKNSKSVVRENGKEIFCLNQNGIADRNNYQTFQFSIDNDQYLHIFKNEELIIKKQIQHDFQIEDIFFKTGHHSIGHIQYESLKHNGFYLLDPCKKRSWDDFYQYYADKQFVNDVIMKCDDDIVFIDLQKLPNFTKFVRNKDDYDLVFANIINNNVSAYYQQNKYELIPRYLMDLEMPKNGEGGTLWANQHDKCKTLHDYFIENYNTFLDYEHNDEFIPIDTRFSINFFGCKGSNWHKIKDTGGASDRGRSDEYNLTVEYVRSGYLHNVFYSGFYVSHLSYFKQIQEGFQPDEIRRKYHKLYDVVKSRF